MGSRPRLRAGGGRLRAGCPTRPSHRSRDAGGGRCSSSRASRGATASASARSPAAVPRSRRCRRCRTPRKTCSTGRERERRARRGHDPARRDGHRGRDERRRARVGVRDAPATLLALPGVPPAGGELDLAAAQREWAARTLDDLRAEAEQAVPAPILAMLAGVAEGARGLVAFGDAYGSFQRGRQAAGIGATATADRWFDDALAKIDELPEGAGPQSGGHPRGARPLRRGAGATARAARRSGPGSGACWQPPPSAHATTRPPCGCSGPSRNRAPVDRLLDHAEAALGAGHVELALTLTDAAVRDFEAALRGASARRRPRRRLRQRQGRRALPARARAGAAGAERSRIRRRTARAFELSDRARALALAALLADASDDTDDERLDPRVAPERPRSGRPPTASLPRVRRHRGPTTKSSRASRSSPRPRTRWSRSRPISRRSAARGRAARRAARSRGHPARRCRPIQRCSSTSSSAATCSSGRSRGRLRTLRRAASRRARSPGSRRRSSAPARTAGRGRRPTSSPPSCSSRSRRSPAAAGRLIVVPYGQLHGPAVPGAAARRARARRDATCSRTCPRRHCCRRPAVDQPLAGRRALVVGDPAFDSAAHPALHRLPGAAVEAGAVAAHARVRPLVGADAVGARRSASSSPAATSSTSPPTAASTRSPRATPRSCSPDGTS